MNIIALKLVTGEDIIGEVESESETEIVLLNPVGISIVRGKDGKPNIGFSPFPLYAKQKSGNQQAIKHIHIVYPYTPDEDFITNYNQVFGSGLIMPPQKTLITG